MGPGSTRLTANWKGSKVTAFRSFLKAELHTNYLISYHLTLFEHYSIVAPLLKPGRYFPLHP